MEIIKGKGVYGAIAIGKIAVYAKKEQTIKRQAVADAEAEVSRFYGARDQAVEELRALYEKAVKEVGESGAMIFEVHQMMLEDLDYLEAVESIIRGQNINAEYATAATGDNFADMFASMDDDYMKERAADVKDISERILKILDGGGSVQGQFAEPVIVAAEDLAPSETVQLDKAKVLAFVTRQGSANSHTAILARTMGIPAVINADISLSEEHQGKKAVVDGFTGTIYLDPDEPTLSAMRVRQQEEAQRRELLLQMKGQENITLDGQRIQIYANIGGEGDLASVLQNDAGGIGLFRTEFLYLEQADYPTEEQQFHVYRKVLETMAGRKVIMRTLDIGADKQIGYFNMDHEENPAMGYRAIRICLDRPEVFKTQLRALYRASVYGTLAIMFPMIISVAEVHQIKAIIEVVKAELDQEQIPYAPVETGIMIETPAAVMISDVLAKEVDFFSVGTNDLTQYTLAIDRQNPKLDQIYDAHHPAVLRMIALTAQNARANDIWIGICGELAADTELTETFLRMGIDELSVSPTAILALRKKVRETDVGKLQE